MWSLILFFFLEFIILLFFWDLGRQFNYFIDESKVIFYFMSYNDACTIFRERF